VRKWRAVAQLSHAKDGPVAAPTHHPEDIGVCPSGLPCEHCSGSPSSPNPVFGRRAAPGTSPNAGSDIALRNRHPRVLTGLAGRAEAGAIGPCPTGVLCVGLNGRLAAWSTSSP
jgi:hypothetical protein